MHRPLFMDNDSSAQAAPVNAVQSGNYIAVFTMFILQDILIQLTATPLSNFNNIVAVANSIANLNSSIKPIQ